MSVLSKHSLDWQHMVVLLYALDTIQGGVPTRRESVEFIQREGLLTLRPEDHRPYESQTEPSWQTDVAYARKDAVMLGFIDNSEWNSWELVRRGRAYLTQTKKEASEGIVTVSRCCLWSLKCKRIFDCSHQPSSTDLKAPPKGQRAALNIREYEEFIEERLKTSTIEQLAAKISGLLGCSIPPKKPSVAFALRQYVLNSL